MIEGVFNKSTYLRKAKISVKAVVSALLIALAVVLPQTVHIAGGAAGGAKWLPMYLPVLIGGCLLGRKWGLGVGVLSPVVSFVITAAAGNAMPAAERLPLMIAELTVFAAVTGSFSDKIAETPAAAFPAVFIAQITGRAVYVAVAALFGGLTSSAVTAALETVRTGLIGLAVQALLVPVIVVVSGKLIAAESKRK